MTEAEKYHALVELITERVGVHASEVLPDSDIEHDLGCVGDDFHELMDVYSKRFKVDMGGYLWYFHTAEEGLNIGSLVFAPPNERVERIPVTLEMLTNFAIQGKWEVTYPEHDLTKHRLDLALNKVLLLLVIVWLIHRLIW